MSRFTPLEQELATEALELLLADGTSEYRAMELIYGAVLAWKKGTIKRDPVQFAHHLISLRKATR
jgi:hypothetical protein